MWPDRSEAATTARGSLLLPTVAAAALSAPSALMAGTWLWLAVERGEMDVTALLTNARSTDQATRQQAEAQIEQAKASNLVRACTHPCIFHSSRLPASRCALQSRPCGGTC